MTCNFFPFFKCHVNNNQWFFVGVLDQKNLFEKKKSKVSLEKKKKKTKVGCNAIVMDNGN